MEKIPSPMVAEIWIEIGELYPKWGPADPNAWMEERRNKSAAGASGQMEEKITDAILSGATDDLFLGLLLEIVIPLVRQKRPLFQNPLDEPVLYQHFIQVTEEALDDLMKVETGMEEAKKITGK